jgi:hypothetical protein
MSPVGGFESFEEQFFTNIKAAGVHLKTTSDF